MMQAFVEWAAMGGHGLYVWLCYGAALLVLVGYVWHLERMDRQTRARIAARLRAVEDTPSAYSDDASGGATGA